MAIFFYLFSSLIVIGSFLVITSKNPVYSVLWLIFTFCNASGIMILLGAEFIAMMLIIIYVGAVAVLFLFVVMMLDVKFIEIKQDIQKNLSFSVIATFILFADLVLVIMLGIGAIEYNSFKGYHFDTNSTNVNLIGKILYTDFIIPFQMGGLILLVAMISCISLTLRHREGVKKQSSSWQNSKSKENSLSLSKIGFKEGIQNVNYD